jgi:hypothetical protein
MFKKLFESIKFWVGYYPPELKDMQRKALENNRIYQSALDKAEWSKDFDAKDVKEALDKQAPKPAVKKTTTRSKTMATKPGLYANIHAKQERIEKQKASGGKVETMRKPGTKGAPTAKAFKESAKTAKK